MLNIIKALKMTDEVDTTYESETPNGIEFHLNLLSYLASKFGNLDDKNLDIAKAGYSAGRSAMKKNLWRIRNSAMDRFLGIKELSEIEKIIEQQQGLYEEAYALGRQDLLKKLPPEAEQFFPVTSVKVLR